MKKLLLLTLALGIGFASVAQVNKLTPRKETNKIKSLQIADETLLSTGPIKQFNNTTSGAKALNKTAFASSGNVITLIVSGSTCLSAVPGLNSALFVARGGGSYGFTSSNVVASWTPDKGATFSNVQVPTIEDATHANRYPSGVLYQPAGVTNVNECFAAYSGISHNNGTWDNDFFGSIRLDSLYGDVLYAPLDSPSRHEFSRIQYSACTDGRVHVLGDNGVSGASPAMYPGISVTTGVFNSGTNSFDWTIKSLSIALKNDPTDGSDQISTWDMAWSADGAIGYAFVVGIDSSAANSNNDWTPVVMKTTDHGATWTQMPFFDFYTIPAVAAKLDDWYTYVGQTGRPRVWFSSGSGTDALVDANGNLHYATLIQCGFSKHADSLGYTYMYEDRVIWDVFTTSTGWDAKVIDTILTLDIANTDPEALGAGSSTTAGWDHRMQLSRSNDGQRVFFTWTDSDTAFFEKVLAPDLYVRGRDINSGVITAEFSMTRGTAYDGANFWHYAATEVFEDATNYEIPITTSTHGATATDPVTHYYFSGVTIPKSAFVGVEENNGNIASISQNYPNPFSTSTTINVNLNKATTLSVDVTNIMGQKIMTINKGNVAAGSHNVVIDGSKLTAGVYFYTVRAGENNVTRKMIVE